MKTGGKKVSQPNKRNQKFAGVQDVPPKTTMQMVEFPPADSAQQNSALRNGYQLGRPALVKKGGQYRVAYKGLKNRRRIPYFLDIYQTLVDLKWRYALLVFCATFFLIYFIFAVIWYILAYAHGDFHNLNNKDWVPCVEKMRTFADSILFSIETQTTIGYGTLYPNTSCGGTVLLVYIQMTVGFLLETILLGFILVKIAKPKHRRHTLMFSDTICICVENGQLSLQVRLGDMRKSHLVDAKAYGIFISEKVSEEGTVYPLFQRQMEFEAHGMDDRVFLMWPLILKHSIDEKSPMYDLEFDEILSNTFEIIIVLEGTVESTGEICQARTSYSSKDIQWGYRFENMVDFNGQTGHWEANFKLFHDVVPTPTPKCSGRDVIAIYNGTGKFDVEIGSEKAGFRRTQSETEPLNFSYQVPDTDRTSLFQREPYDSKKWRLSMP